MIRVSLFLILVLTACWGCTGAPASQGAGTTDPEVAKVIQNQVDEYLVNAQKMPARAKAELDLLLETLEGAADRSAAFAKVRDEGKTLQELYASNAPKPQIEEQTTVLKTSADALTQ